MADIKLVIKIPEEIRLVLINNIQLSMDQQSICDSYIQQAIINGTPLPKGHGRLIDEDTINNRFYDICLEAENVSNKPTYKYLLDKLTMCIDDAPTVIEADKE